MSQKPSFLNVTQKEWDDHGNRLKETRIKSLMQEYNLTREQAEIEYEELPI